jgi:hypothetical protein
VIYLSRCIVTPTRYIAIFPNLRNLRISEQGDRRQKEPTVIVAARFNGPPGSGNGGYSAGLVGVRFAATHRDATHRDAAHRDATHRDAGVEVTLRRPPPLDTEMTVREERAILASDADRTVAVLRVYERVDDRDALVAEALATTVHDDEVVPGVPFAEAVEASASCQGIVSHPFPTCFVCGPLRPAGPKT